MSARRVSVALIGVALLGGGVGYAIGGGSVLWVGIGALVLVVMVCGVIVCFLPEVELKRISSKPQVRLALSLLERLLDVIDTLPK